MGFSMSGLAAGGAAKGLEEMVKEAMLQEQMDAAAKEREQDNSRADRSLNMQSQWHDEARTAAEQARADALANTTRDNDRADAMRRDQNNRWGVEDMMRQAAAQQPKPTKLTKITTQGPNGKPVAKGVTDEELMAGVPEYREPKDPKGSGGGDKMWLLRGGEEVYDTYKPGDKRAPTAGTGDKDKGERTSATVLGEIRQLSKRINTESSGPQAKMTGLLRKGNAMIGNDNTLEEYDSLVSGFTPMVARAVGHNGVLTEQDVQSVKALFPKVGDNAKLATAKLDRVDRIMSGRETFKLPSMGGGGGGGAAAPSDSTAPPDVVYVPGKGLVPYKK